MCQMMVTAKVQLASLMDPVFDGSVHLQKVRVFDNFQLPLLFTDKQSSPHSVKTVLPISLCVSCMQVIYRHAVGFS